MNSSHVPFTFSDSPGHETGTRNVRSLCSIGSIKSVAGELPKYKLHLVKVQEMRWEGKGYQIAGYYTFFYGKGEC